MRSSARAPVWRVVRHATAPAQAERRGDRVEIGAGTTRVDGRQRGERAVGVAAQRGRAAHHDRRSAGRRARGAAHRLPQVGLGVGGHGAAVEHRDVGVVAARRRSRGRRASTIARTASLSYWLARQPKVRR